MLELRQHFPLADLLSVAGLPRSTFYYQWRAGQAGDKYASLKARICAIFEQHQGRYGYRRITEVVRQQGWPVNHKTVQRLMGLLRLKSCVRVKKYRSYRGALNQLAPNVLQRQFQAAQPNKKWATDVTEFKVGAQKLYLSPVMDLCNGEILAYEMATRPSFAMVANMLKQACTRLGPSERPILHSDQGWQYQMPAYRELLAQHGVTPSMSRRGNCLDNAAIESFFGTLKAEFYHLSTFQTIEQLKDGIARYIHYYNHERIKLKLNGLSPVQYRTQLLAT